MAALEPPTEMTMRFVWLCVPIASLLTWLALQHHRLQRRVMATYLQVYDEPCPQTHLYHAPGIYTQAQRRLRRGWQWYGLAMAVLLGLTVTMNGVLIWNSFATYGKPLPNPGEVWCMEPDTHPYKYFPIHATVLALMGNRVSLVLMGTQQPGSPGYVSDGPTQSIELWAFRRNYYPCTRATL